MTIEMFLSVVFQISVGIAFTGLCVSGVAVSLYYSYKMGVSLIKRRDHYAGKLTFSSFLKPKKVKADGKV